MCQRNKIERLLNIHDLILEYANMFQKYGFYLPICHINAILINVN